MAIVEISETAAGYPNAIDLRAILGRDTATLDAAAYVLNKVTREYINRGVLGARLSAWLMRSQLGRNRWDRVKAGLDPVLDIGRGYLPGSYCKSYSIKGEVWSRTSGLKWRKVRDSQIIGAINRHNKETHERRTREGLNEIFSGPMVAKQLENLAEIRVDYSRARQIAAKMKLPAKRRACQFTEEEYQKMQKMRLLVMHQSRGRSSVDEFGWRMHSPITRHPKRLRKYLTVDGEQMAGIDFRNSLPMMLAILLETIRNQGAGGGKGGKTTQYGMIPIVCWHILRTAGPRLGCLLEEVAGSKSARDYVETCSQGVLYKELATHGLSEDDVKRSLFWQVFFSQVDSDEDEPSVTSELAAQRSFRERFPDVSVLLDEMRRPGRFIGYTPFFGDSKMQSAPHRSVAMALQRIESVLMREHVFPHWLNVSGDGWAVTLHDSLVVRADLAELARECVEEAVQDACGLRIGTRVDWFGGRQLAALC